MSLLNLLTAHILAGFTLQMVEQPRQSNKLLPTVADLFGQW